MTDERQHDAALLPTVLGAIEALRTDVREDIAEVRAEVGEGEARLMSALSDGLRDQHSDFVEYIGGHRDEHDARDAESDRTHETMHAFIRAAELSQARRDGALGIVRFGVELVARNWRALAGIALAFAGGVGLLTGHLEVRIGA